MPNADYHGQHADDVAAELGTRLDTGLAKQEAQARLARLGGNELHEQPRPGWLALLGAQFNNYLVIILILAASISLALGEYVDAIAILFIVTLNAVVGVIQESKAEQALEALKKMAAPHAQVIRDGHQLTIPGREIVIGDLVVLEAGNYVPADLRLVDSINLKIEEASLTGESLAVGKDASLVLDHAIPLGDRKNTAFMGTLISYGRGRGLVIATGMNTQIGLIATMIQSYTSEDTPLQKKLAHLGKVLGSACLAICALVFIYGLFRDTHLTAALHGGFFEYLGREHQEIINLFMTAVSLAIAAVPEGLPAIVTICLALGMQQMIKRHALVRKLPAVETLGCATVVCTDKTGTLTQNAMTVVQAWVGKQHLYISGEGYRPKGDFRCNSTAVVPLANTDIALLLTGAMACNDARLDEEEGAARIIGDPTEGALVVAASKGGLVHRELDAALPRIQEIPFDSERKRMTTIHRVAGEAGQSLLSGLPATPCIAFVKGAPDVILDLCAWHIEEAQVLALNEESRQRILSQNQDMARAALRVLAVACRPHQDALKLTPTQLEQELIFIGLLGMIDPPRPEVIEALKVARGAGLKSIMITGDYRDTAEAIARQIGLLSPGGRVLSGAEIEKLSDPELAAQVDTLAVCCRVSPQHKTRIVDALKSRGHIVAMTGDGVNDAPALKRANIGIAMGITGSDVAKQTADMILTDDNFASIVAAIEQGRTIYANIRKFVYFLLACNVGEILIIFGAMLLGMPIPLRPVQLLWLNLVSDGAPALALGLEKADVGIMDQPPRSPQEPVIDRQMAIGIGIIGITDALAILAVFYLALQRYPGQLAAAQTIAFATLSCSELIRAFTARSETHSIFTIGLLSNRWMLGAVATSFLLVLVAIYLPLLQTFFGTVPLTPADWLLMLPFLFASPLAMELLKLRRR